MDKVWTRGQKMWITQYFLKSTKSICVNIFSIVRIESARNLVGKVLKINANGNFTYEFAFVRKQRVVIINKSLFLLF